MDEEVSPDGRTLVRWAVNTGRMSHEIWTPTILDVETGAPILELADSGFDGRPSWTEDGGFSLTLRHYWRPGVLDIWVNRTSGTFTFGREDASTEPLSELSRRVEERFADFEQEAAQAEKAGNRTRLLQILLILAVGLASVLFLLLLAVL